MAIEIVSANDTFASLDKKAERYRRCGTREVWTFVQFSRKAYLHSESRNVILYENDEFRPEAIPGFTMRIGELLDRSQD